MKYNICKITLAFILIISTVFTLENIGNYDTKYIIVGENYVAKLPQALNVPVIVNNKFLVPLNPHILINDDISTITFTIDPELVERSTDRYVFEGSSIKHDVEIFESIEMNGKSMTSKVSFRNRGNTNANIKVTYGMEFDGRAALFFPYLVDNFTKNYIVAADPSLEGNSMGIATNFDMNTLPENFENISSWIAGGNVRLEPGQTTEFNIVFYFFNIQKPGERNYPIEISSFLSEPLVKTTGEVENISIDETADKAEELISKINQSKISGSPGFGDFRDMNLDSTTLNSLGMSMYFKKLCAKVDVPCRLVVGKVGSESYAWVRVYDNGWVDVDPYNAVKITPTGYNIYYEEPEFEVIVLSDEDMDQAYLGATGFLASLGQNLFLVYLVIIVIAGLIILAVFQLKPTKIGEYFGIERKKIIRKVEVGGEYVVLKRKIDDPFLNEVLRKVIENNGKVDIKRFANELNYSPELIRSGITYLVDRKCLKTKKIEIAIEEEEKIRLKVPKPAVGGFFTEFINTLKVLNKKQIYLLIAVILIAIIVLLALLLI